MAVLVGALVMIVVSLGMILCLQIVRFSCLLKRRDGWTDGPTDGPTDLRTDRPSYRDERTHLKRTSLETTFIYVKKHGEFNGATPRALRGLLL